MENHPVKYGIDRCPATKNMSHAAFCQQCDFRSREQKDCCECAYYTLSKKAKEHKQPQALH